MNCLSEAFNVP